MDTGKEWGYGQITTKQESNYFIYCTGIYSFYSSAVLSNLPGGLFFFLRLQSKLSD